MAAKQRSPQHLKADWLEDSSTQTFYSGVRTKSRTENLNGKMWTFICPCSSKILIHSSNEINHHILQ